MIGGSDVGPSDLVSCLASYFRISAQRPYEAATSGSWRLTWPRPAPFLLPTSVVAVGSTATPKQSWLQGVSACLSTACTPSKNNVYTTTRAVAKAPVGWGETLPPGVGLAEVASTAANAPTSQLTFSALRGLARHAAPVWCGGAHAR